MTRMWYNVAHPVVSMYLCIPHPPPPRAFRYCLQCLIDERAPTGNTVESEHNFKLHPYRDSQCLVRARRYQPIAFQLSLLQRSGRTNRICQGSSGPNGDSQPLLKLELVKTFFTQPNPFNCLLNCTGTKSSKIVFYRTQTQPILKTYNSFFACHFHSTFAKDVKDSKTAK